MYISATLKYKRLKKLCFDFDGCETEFIQLQEKYQNKSVIVGVIYRHPHDNHDIYFEHLGHLLENIAKNNKVILCGDINIDTTPGISTKTVLNYRNLLLSFGCYNIINKYTRIATKDGATSKTTIDHIVTNINTNQTRSGVLHFNLADHFPTFALLNLTPERQRLTYTKRSYNSLNKLKFMNLVKDKIENKFSSNEITDPDKSLDELVNIIGTSEDEAFPLRKMSKKHTKIYRKSWMTKGIWTSMKDRDKLFRK